MSEQHSTDQRIPLYVPDDPSYTPDQETVLARPAIIEAQVGPLRQAADRRDSIIPEVMIENTFRKRTLENLQRVQPTEIVGSMIAESQATLKAQAAAHDAKTTHLRDLADRTERIAEADPESVDRGRILNPEKAEEMARAEKPSMDKANRLLTRLTLHRKKYIGIAALYGNVAGRMYDHDLRRDSGEY